MTFGQITSIIIIDIKPKEVINMDKYKKFASDRKDDIVNLLSELVAIPSVMVEAMLITATVRLITCPTVLTRQNLQFFVTWTSCRKEKAGVMNLLSVPKRTVFSMAEA